MQHLPIPTIHAKILAYGCTTMRGIESRGNPERRQTAALPECAGAAFGRAGRPGPADAAGAKAVPRVACPSPYTDSRCPPIAMDGPVVNRLKPRRGGLFIAPGPPPPSFFLFFSGAGTARSLSWPPAAPLKNKKKGCESRFSYRQATPDRVIEAAHGVGGKEAQKLRVRSSRIKPNQTKSNRSNQKAQRMGPAPPAHRSSKALPRAGRQHAPSTRATSASLVRPDWTRARAESASDGLAARRSRSPAARPRRSRSLERNHSTRGRRPR